MTTQLHHGGGNKRGEREAFGSIRKLPSGRHQARYTGPDGATHAAPHTFETKGDAQAWLRAERKLMTDPDREWTSPRDRKAAKRVAPMTFGEYALTWLEHRKLAARTRVEYRKLLDQLILPTFGAMPLKAITADAVRSWYARTAVGTPTHRAHAYGLLRTVMGQAEHDELVVRNPVHIRGAGSVKRAKKIEPATLEELETILEVMPAKHRLMVLFAAWCALRFGELTELRRGDVDTRNGVLRIRRAVVRVDGEEIVKEPKSEAGIRDVAIPPHLMSAVREHLLEHAAPGKDGLLFPARSGRHLAASSFFGRAAVTRRRVRSNRETTRRGWGYKEARRVAGRPDLSLHDLRHTGATYAAQTGATLAELMGRLGHSTPGAAMRYQHAAKGRDAQIAAALSAMVEAQS